MQRKDFLKGAGLAGFTTILPFKPFHILNGDRNSSPAACTLTPTETEGPYPYPAGEVNNPLLRSDIRETKTGVLLTLTITVSNLGCTPVPGARVDVWQCDKDGYYSGYNGQMGYLGTQNNSGQTWLRGYQLTNSSGQVTFTTIYPGWYVGRTTHFHVEIFTGTTVQKITQLAFPDSLNTTVNGVYAHGRNNSVANNALDNVFSDGTTDEILTISGDTTNGYSASRTIVINFAVLPLSLLSFNAGIVGNNTILWWSTENEFSAGYFEIERSSDSILFSSIGTVTAKNGSGTNNYTFTDIALRGTSYYRLKMFNKDGSYKYANVVLLKNNGSQKVSIYPNPVLDHMVLNHPEAGVDAVIKILSFEGKEIASGTLQAGATSSLVNVTILTKGTYLLVFETNTDRQVIKFLKD